VSRGAAEGCRDLKVRWWDVSYLAMWPGVCSLSRRVSVMYDGFFLVFWVFGFFFYVSFSMFLVLVFGLGFFSFLVFLSFGGFALGVLLWGFFDFGFVFVFLFLFSFSFL